jgi:hypothetical protein
MVVALQWYYSGCSATQFMVSSGSKNSIDFVTLVVVMMVVMVISVGG